MVEGPHKWFHRVLGWVRHGLAKHKPFTGVVPVGERGTCGVGWGRGNVRACVCGMVGVWGQADVVQMDLDEPDSLGQQLEEQPRCLHGQEGKQGAIWCVAGYEKVATSPAAGGAFRGVSSVGFAVGPPGVRLCQPRGGGGG